MSGGGTQVSTTNVEPWTEQKGYLTGGFEKAKEIYDRGAPDYYSGETLAGFDPASKAAQRSILGYATGKRAMAQQAGAERQLLDTYGLSKNLARKGGLAANRGLNLQGALSQGQYSRLNPYSQGQYADLLSGDVRTGSGTPYAAMENALSQGVVGNLNKNILPQLRQQQIQYQPGGSSRGMLEQNKAISDAVQSGLTKPLAEMYGGAYQQAQGMRMPAAQMGLQAQQYGMNYGLQGQDRARQAGELGLQGVSMYPSTMNAPLSMYNAMNQVGEDRRAMSQAVIDRKMAKYEYDANKDQNALRNYMAMVSGDYGSTTTSTVPGQSGLGTLGQIAGIAGSLGFSPFSSDARLKDNVTHIGEDKGYNIYTWEWNDKAVELGIDTPTVGVMAQEVLETNPDAVSVSDNGYYQVNYGAL